MTGTCCVLNDCVSFILCFSVRQVNFFLKDRYEGMMSVGGQEGFQ